MSYLVEGAAKQERERDGLPYLDLAMAEARWGTVEDYLRAGQVQAVIRGISLRVEGPNAEEVVSAAAGRIGTPVFVVEDFPGNYWPGAGASLAGLFVEHESLVDLYRDRGVDPRVVQVTGCPRYAPLAHVDRDAKRAATRKALGLQARPAMLWAGQPDGENSYLTLQRLLKGYANEPFTLLFRAHPRDSAYSDGSYSNLLDRSPVPVMDVTSHDDIIALICASDLVATQFSSVAVEAGHLGVPPLFVLFEDLAKQNLRSLMGYDMLPWCRDRCSFLIEGTEEVKDILKRALFDEVSRDQVRANFQRIFGATTDSARAIARRIRAVVGKCRDAGGAAV